MKKELLSISLALLLLMPIGLTDNSLGNDIALSNCAPIPVGISYGRDFYFNQICNETKTVYPTWDIPINKTFSVEMDLWSTESQ